MTTTHEFQRYSYVLRARISIDQFLDGLADLFDWMSRTMRNDVASLPRTDRTLSAGERLLACSDDHCAEMADLLRALADVIAPDDASNERQQQRDARFQNLYDPFFAAFALTVGVGDDRSDEAIDRELDRLALQLRALRAAERAEEAKEI